jgi:hypothetical protein
MLSSLNLKSEQEPKVKKILLPRKAAIAKKLIVRKSTVNVMEQDYHVHHNVNVKDAKICQVSVSILKDNKANRC